MKRTIAIGMGLAVIFSLAACSVQKKQEPDTSSSSESAPTADAGTDAVPPDLNAQASPESTPPADATAAAVPSVDTSSAQANTPSTEAPASTAVAGSGQFEDYTIKAGDTLMRIAFEEYGDLYQWKHILELNKDKISDPNHLSANTVIKLEKPSSPVAIERNGDKYLIQHGDTLGKISNTVYGTSKKWKKLWENNKQLIHDPNKIYAGFYLYYILGPEDKQTNPQPLTQNTPAEAAPAAAPADNAAAASAPAAPSLPAASAPSADAGSLPQLQPTAPTSERAPSSAAPGAGAGK
jgi:LysM repeat protein